MPSHSSRPVVLLVEDSEDDAFFFRYSLKKSGVACTLLHVPDGAQAIEYLQAGLASPADPQRPWPDLVFLDLKLPTFSGFEILGWIREQRIESRLDVAVLSGSEHRSDVERATALGATGYYVKPVSVDHLRQRLQLWHEQHSSGSGAGTLQATA